MAFPAPSVNDHNAPWNLDTDDEGVTRCYCSACNAQRRKAALDEGQEDQEWGRFSRCK